MSLDWVYKIVLNRAWINSAYISTMLILVMLKLLFIYNTYIAYIYFKKYLIIKIFSTNMIKK